jgi:hypothetical protein
MCRGGSPTAMRDWVRRFGVSRLIAMEGESNVDAVVRAKRMRSDWFKQRLGGTTSMQTSKCALGQR